MEDRVPVLRIASLERFLALALLVPALAMGCAPSRIAGRPPASQEPAKPEPTPGPAPTASPSPAPPPARIDFVKQILPVLQERCTPCHFTGGRMYERLPFDREDTIRTLGAAALIRLRDPVDQDLVRTFLAQPVEEPGSPPSP